MNGGTSFTFVTDELRSTLGQAKEAGGNRNISITGGASTIQQRLKAGLLDELQIYLVPVLLGDGIRLFKISSTPPQDLE